MTPRSATSGQDGFALIATVAVVLFLLAIAAALILPPVLGSRAALDASASASELQSLYTAIVGDQINTFGYFGDVGEYPASLMDLVRDPSSTPGWKGPYLTIPAGGIVNGMIVDAYGNPFEYYLLDNTQNNPDRLAIISRGPDGQSSASLAGSPPANPNVASGFAGTLPTANTYKSQTGNADNVVFPAIDSANNDTLLRASVIGTLQINFGHFDYNASVNTYVPACAGLYTARLQSAARGTSDVRSEYLGGVTAFDLPEGAWNVTITSLLTSAPVYAGSAVVTPNATTPLAVNYNPGINSRGNAVSTWSVHNLSGNSASARWNGSIAGSVGNGGTATFSPPGCNPVDLLAPGNIVIDSFTMPYKVVGPVAGTVFGRTPGAAAVSVTIVNNSTAGEVRVYVNAVGNANGVQIAQVAKKRSKSFVMATGDYLTITNNLGNSIGAMPIQINSSQTLTY